MASNYQKIEKLKKMVEKEFSIDSSIKMWAYSPENLRMQPDDYVVYLDFWARHYEKAGGTYEKTECLKNAHGVAVKLLEKQVSGEELDCFKKVYGDYYLKDIDVVNFYNSNVISNISPLANLINLKSLNLEYCNNISDVSSIAKLFNLNYLNLNSTKCSDISSLANIINLEGLYM